MSEITVQEAVRVLTTMGLAVRESKDPSNVIVLMGGVELKEILHGIGLYTQPFAIHRISEGYEVMTRDATRIVPVDSLAEAVAIIISTYQGQLRE